MKVTQSGFMFGCPGNCMMRCGDNNHHVHDGYGKEMAPSLDVNDTVEDTEEDKSNNSIVHNPFDDLHRRI